MLKWTKLTLKGIFLTFLCGLLLVILTGIYGYLTILYPKTDFWKATVDSVQILGGFGSIIALILMRYDKNREIRSLKITSLREKLSRILEEIQLSTESINIRYIDYLDKEAAKFRSTLYDLSEVLGPHDFTELEELKGSFHNKIRTITENIDINVLFNVLTNSKEKLEKHIFEKATEEAETFLRKSSQKVLFESGIDNDIYLYQIFAVIGIAKKSGKLALVEFNLAYFVQIMVELLVATDSGLKEKLRHVDFKNVGSGSKHPLFLRRDVLNIWNLPKLAVIQLGLHPHVHSFEISPDSP